MHYPIIVIGAGAGGLVIAIGAARAGKRILLIEKGPFGGDCTNYGCIPSKSTIAAAAVAHQINTAHNFGIDLSNPEFKATRALARTRTIVNEIRSHEEPTQLKEMGVDTLIGSAAFIDAHTLNVTLGEGMCLQVKADQIVIATGSHPAIPSIPGIDTVPYLTNKTIFDLCEIPTSLAIVGGGPIGCELAQAYQRLGAHVSIIHRHSHLLNKEIPLAQLTIEEIFRKEGIDLYLESEPLEVANQNGQVCIRLNDKEIKAAHLLISAGRLPNIDALNLNDAGINFTKRGIIVDRFGRTNKKNVWAVGDVTGRAIFTHIAENEARTVLTSLLLPCFLKKKLDLKQPIPRVTFTEPEVASIGLCTYTADKVYGQHKIATYTLPLSEVDRAITTGQTDGFVQVVTKKWSGKILGATIVAPRAGEMLMEISTAMYGGLSLRKLASLIHPYPTYSLAIRKIADQWLTKTIVPTLKKFFKRS